jgi:anaerobic magnesium-protoporphyrin IX monomethyl ester cyclase
MSKLDVLFVEPNSAQEAYQELSHSYSAIETPTWSLLLAQSCRSQGFEVAILDCVAERLTVGQAVQKIRNHNPRLVVFVMYGQNPNSGTTNMIGANKLAASLKEVYPEYFTCFVGSHVSALPKEVLKYPWVDFILQNEGVYALWNLLKVTNFRDWSSSELSKVRGIGYKYGVRGLSFKSHQFKNFSPPPKDYCQREVVKQFNELDSEILILTPPENIVPQERMDFDLPGYAWDLLPYHQKPLDLYRSHFWHAEFDHNKRIPFAAIYTSLGCRFACNFCMINIVNRVNNEDGIVSSDSKGMRYWSPEFILKQFEQLASMGAQTVRISDEMFFLDKRYFNPLLTGIVERGIKFNMWAYSRIDTVQKQYLELFKKAGINWLALGVEAANQEVRTEISKGSFKNINIRDVVKTVRDADISVISNYIFGFPTDTRETMQQTLDLAIELNTETANMYPCQALPGSPLYLSALANKQLPSTLQGFAFLSYETEPLPTKFLSSAEVLRFRDEAWQKYFTNPAYLSLVENKFGQIALNNVKDMTKIKLKRKLLGD